MRKLAFALPLLLTLAVTDGNYALPDAAAVASADSGDQAGLYTRAGFGCTEHPANSK